MKCKFPFIFAAQKYDTCTDDLGVQIAEGDFWCATDLNGSGEMIDGKWGICSNECVVNWVNNNFKDS